MTALSEATREAIAKVIEELADKHGIKECCGQPNGGNYPDEPPACCANPVVFIPASETLAAILALLAEPKTGEREKALEEAAINNLKSRLDTRLNNWLCEMKPDHDDSIVGFNEAWDIVNKVFKDTRALKSTPKPVGEDVVERAQKIVAEFLPAFHRSSCYPDAMPVEIRGAAKAIISRLASANLLRKE